MSKTSIRALMAQEQQSRRIAHEFATYNKNVLSCTACHLNIKSETLWDGHLRSANHRANAKKAHAATRTAGKRKVEEMEEAQTEPDDVRKKLRPKGRGEEENGSGDGGDQDRKRKVDVDVDEEVEEVATADPERKRQRLAIARDPDVDVDTDSANVLVNTDTTTVHPSEDTQPAASDTIAVVDESEWAAFERDIASLAQTDYSSATITAAPVSAAQLAAEAEADRKRLRDTEAEDEKEDEGRRMVEEFDVMEEMEGRVRKLREKREALRSMGTGKSAADGVLDTDADTRQEDEQRSDVQRDEEMDEKTIDESDEDIDDWYS